MDFVALLLLQYQIQIKEVPMENIYIPSDFKNTSKASAFEHIISKFHVKRVPLKKFIFFKAFGIIIFV